jgi:hypothetical protein
LICIYGIYFGLTPYFKTARNAFVLQALLDQKLSPKQFQQLAIVFKREKFINLQEAFRDNFFEFTRDGSWMQKAAGLNRNWLDIPGIIDWHVRAAINTLTYKDTTGTFNYSLVEHPELTTSRESTWI